MLLESIRQVKRVYLQHFMYGWLQAVKGFASTSYVFPALLIAAILGMFLLMVMGRDGSAVEADRRTLGAAEWSFGAVLMGFVMYIPTAVRNDSFRVFLFSSWGAALVVAIAVHVVGSLFGRWASAVIVLIVSILIAASAVRAYNDFHAFEEDGLRQQRVMPGIVRQAPKDHSGDTACAHRPRGMSGLPGVLCLCSAEYVCPTTPALRVRGTESQRACLLGRRFTDGQVRRGMSVRSRRRWRRLH